MATRPDIPDELYSIFVIAPSDQPRPIKVACSFWPVDYLSATKSQEARQLVIHSLFWVTDRKLAVHIAKRCRHIFKKAGKDPLGGWFDVTGEWAVKVIVFAANDAGIRLYNEAEARAMKTAFLAEIGELVGAGMCLTKWKKSV